MRFEESHVTAIRFHQVRTGRDVLGEIRTRFGATTEDSARMVFGTMLAGLGDTPNVEQLAAQFRSGSPPQIALAQRSLYTVFRGRPARADAATTASILDRLVASNVEGGEPWPSLMPPPSNPPPPRIPPRAGAPAERLYMLADSVPPALRERWRDRVTFISAAEWAAMPVRQAGTLLTLSDVQRVGPFVRVSVYSSGRLARQPDETPRLFYGSTTYYLLARGDGWVVVGMDMSIT